MKKIKSLVAIACIAGIALASAKAYAGDSFQDCIAKGNPPLQCLPKMF